MMGLVLIYIRPSPPADTAIRSCDIVLETKGVRDLVELQAA